MRYAMLYIGLHAHETAADRAGVGDALNSRIHGHSRLVEYSHYLAHTRDDADAAAKAVASRFSVTSTA